MSEFEQVKPYTQVELDQQAIWASEFDQWWQSEGQYHRAGGNEYCRTFAWWAWLNREQSKQSEIDQLKAEKEAVLELAKQWQETARQLSITDDKHVICSLLSCAEEVEEALRGGHE